MAKGIKKGISFVMLLLTAIVGMVLVGTEVFQIRKITILGYDESNYNDIIKKSGIEYGENIFKIDKTLVKERIETNPYWKVISVDREFPNELVIEINERKAAAAIPYLNTFFIIDDQGIILEISKNIANMDLPIVQGIQVRSFVLGQKLVAGENYQLNAMLRMLDAIYKHGLGDRISEIKMEDVEDIHLISTEGLLIRIGQAVDVDKKLLWLKSEEVNSVCNGAVKGVLDLSSASQPVFLFH